MIKKEQVLSTCRTLHFVIKDKILKILKILLILLTKSRGKGCSLHLAARFRLLREISYSGHRDPADTEKKTLLKAYTFPLHGLFTGYLCPLSVFMHGQVPKQMGRWIRLRLNQDVGFWTYITLLLVSKAF